MPEKRNLDWIDVAHLPADHPRRKRFEAQVDAEMKMLDDAYKHDCTGMFSAHNEEGSLAHFDRYVAGDR